MARPLSLISLALAPATLLAIAGGCGDLQTSGSSHYLGTEGRWRAPAHILAEGDTQTVAYTGAGAWLEDESTCQGTFTDGGQALGDYIKTYFPQVYTVGGYSCRPIVGNPNQTSVHATGRALDLMIRTTVDGDADNDLGDPVAHWLIQNAEFIGIQFIIWDRTTWGAERSAGDKERSYSGANPHLDHLHIELSVEGGNMGTDWFASGLEPPLIDSCPALPAEGGVIDDTDACTQLLGPGEFWRAETGQGYGDSLVWTNAIERDDQGNWARWQIVPSEAGEYEIEVYGDTEFSVHKNARYELIHAEQSSEFTVDQSSLAGWHSLGSFDFKAGGGQALEVFDNGPDPVDSEQHIAVDAIRVSLVGGPGPDPDPDPDPTDPEDDEDDPGTVFGGCSSGGSASGGSSSGGSSSGGSSAVLLAGLFLLFAVRREAFRGRRARSRRQRRAPRLCD